MGNDIAEVRVFPQTKFNAFTPRIRKGENLCVRAASRLTSPAIIGELTRRVAKRVPHQILVRRRSNLECTASE